MTATFGQAWADRDRRVSWLVLALAPVLAWIGLEGLTEAAGLGASLVVAGAVMAGSILALAGSRSLAALWALWALVRWRSACRSCGLGRTASPWRDGVGARAFWPARAWWTADAHTLRIRVRVPHGMTATSVLDLAPALAASLRGVRGWGTYRDEAHVLVDVVMRDPLRASRPASMSTEHGVARWARDEAGADLVWSPAAGHTAIQGTTGSGKSSSTYTLLAPLAARRDVIVCGSDVSGLVLDPWRPVAPDLIATGGSDLEAHALVLERAVGIMTERLAGLVAAGRDQLHCDAGAPWLVVVIEEAPGLIAAAKSTDRDVHARIVLAARRLKQEGRKAGLVVLTIAQRMSAQVIDADARSQEAVRITHRVDTPEALRMLHDGATLPDLAEVRQWLPGLALVEMPGRRLTRVRVDFVSYADYRSAVLAAVSRQVPALGDARDRLDDVADLERPTAPRRTQPKRPRPRAQVTVTERESDPMAEQSQAEEHGSSGPAAA